MGSETRKKIQDAIRELGKADKYEVHIGKVVKINESEATVDVDISEDVIVYDVRLRAVIDDKTGFILWPELNSYISFTEIHGGPNHCLVKASKLKKMTLEIGKSTLEITDGNIVFNGGNNKGIPISEKVIDRLNKIESDINSLKQLLLTMTANTSATPLVPGTLATLFSSWTSQILSVSQLNQIENNKIKH
jgi:hypothetical protein